MKRKTLKVERRESLKPSNLTERRLTVFRKNLGEGTALGRGDESLLLVGKNFRHHPCDRPSASLFRTGKGGYEKRKGRRCENLGEGEILNGMEEGVQGLPVLAKEMVAGRMQKRVLEVQFPDRKNKFAEDWHSA